jgi:nitrite reductase/ring-hydroxylating ferredoxin subunit/uncharacterized membrane protein
VLNQEVSLNRRAVDRLARNPQLEAIATAVQPTIKGAVDAAGPAVQNLLHGTTIGHALHPAITDVPVGAWTVTAVLDALELCGNDAVAPGGDAALLVGLAGAAGAIASGWADWSDTKDDARSVGMAHAMVNGIATTGYIASLFLRKAGARKAGIALSLGSYAVVSLGAYLGGVLSLDYGLGTKHTAIPVKPKPEFVPVIAASSLGDTPTSAEYDGIPLLITRTHDGVFAISGVCTHRGAPLADGTFADGCVTCPWHGSKFSLTDGHVVQGPATFPQAQFEARIGAGDMVEVRPLVI